MKPWCAISVLYWLTRVDCKVFRNFERQLLTIDNLILIIMEVFMPQKSVMLQVRAFLSSFLPQRASLTGHILISRLSLGEKKKKKGSELKGSETKNRNEIKYKIQMVY